MYCLKVSMRPRVRSATFLGPGWSLKVLVSLYIVRHISVTSFSISSAFSSWKEPVKHIVVVVVVSVTQIIVQSHALFRPVLFGCITNQISSLLFPLNELGQCAYHYCHWFLELSFSRIRESTTGYTFTPCMGSFTSPGIDS